VGAFDGFDGHRIGDPEILYRKLDMNDAEKFRKKFSGEAPDFGRYRLAVGTVTAAEKHPGADHLYVLSVDCAEGGQRTLAAGLARHYSPEELSGRKVVVLTNLTPADIKGVTSQGMVLVCEKRNKLELLDASPFENGQIAEVPDQRVDHSEITIDQFKAAPLRVVNGVLMFDDQQCTINGIPVKTHAVKNGKVR
jgi:methionine--tRNA ligase beta chain